MKKFVVIVSVVLMALGWLLGLLFIGDSVFGFLDGIRESITDTGEWAVIVFSALFVLIVSGLFFIGGLGSAFIYMSIMLFGVWRGFIISAVCILISSIATYTMGRYIGEKPFKWAIGDTNYDKARKIVASPTFVALALVFPGFPDTLVCFFAGSSKMKLLTFSIIALITRTIGVATICFLGSGILSIETWKPCYEAIGLIPTLMIAFSSIMSFGVLVYAFFKVGKGIENMIDKKKLLK